MIIRILLLLSLLASNAALACSTRGTPYSKDTVLSSDNIFYATVVSKEKVDEQVEIITLSITENFKGEHSAGKSVQVKTGASSSCKMKVAVGKNYFFFYNNSQEIVGMFNKWDQQNSSLKPVLDNITSELRSVNQALKAQPSAAGDAASGAP